MEYQIIQEAVLNGDDQQALTATEALLAAGDKALDIINLGLLQGMAEVGRLFKEGELFVPEVMMSANTVTQVIDRLKPLIEGEQSSQGTVVLGTVKGDLHDIGKNLVKLLLESNGFTVVDLGADVAPERFVEAAQSARADIVGLSALLTTTMPNMQATISAFAAAGCRERYKIIVGGAPVSAAYAAEISADGHSEDAVGAVALCKRLLGQE